MLYRKSAGTTAKLGYLGHPLMENRHGLLVDTLTTQATGTVEREAGVELVHVLGGSRRITLSAGNNYTILKAS